MRRVVARAGGGSAPGSDVIARTMTRSAAIA